MQAADRTTFIVERLKAGARLSNLEAPLGQCWVLEEAGQTVDVVTAQEMRRLMVKGLIETDTKHPSYLASLTSSIIVSEPLVKLVSDPRLTDGFSNGSIAELVTLELAATAPIASAAQPYTFDQLLRRREAKELRMNLLFHIHVPKAGGNTVGVLLRHSLGTFFPLEFNMSTSSFFTIMPEDRWLENYQGTGHRRAFLMSGHFRMDAQTLLNAPAPHAITTTLRDPIERVLSHYNHTLCAPGSPWRDEVMSGEMSFLEYAETLLVPNGIGPQYSFFDDTGNGTFARSGTASAEHCLRNLVNKVGVFGFIERFDEFAALAAYVLNKGNALFATPQNVTRNMAAVTGTSLKTTLTDDEQFKVRQIFGDDVWFYEEAKKEYARRIADPKVQEHIASALPLLEVLRETIERHNKLPTAQP